MEKEEGTDVYHCIDPIYIKYTYDTKTCSFSVDEKVIEGRCNVGLCSCKEQRVHGFEKSFDLYEEAYTKCMGTEGCVWTRRPNPFFNPPSTKSKPASVTFEAAEVTFPTDKLWNQMENYILRDWVEGITSFKFKEKMIGPEGRTEQGQKGLFKVIIKDGKLMQRKIEVGDLNHQRLEVAEDKELVELVPNNYKWVAMPTSTGAMKVYAVLYDDPVSDKRAYHAQLTGGRSIYTGGQMVVAEGGKLQSINPGTGHYGGLQKPKGQETNDAYGGLVGYLDGKDAYYDDQPQRMTNIMNLFKAKDATTADAVAYKGKYFKLCEAKIPLSGTKSDKTYCLDAKKKPIDACTDGLAQVKQGLEELKGDSSVVPDVLPAGASPLALFVDYYNAQSLGVHKTTTACIVEPYGTAAGADLKPGSFGQLFCPA